MFCRVINPLAAEDVKNGLTAAECAANRRWYTKAGAEGVKIAETVWAAWRENGVRPDTMAINLSHPKSDDGRFDGNDLPVNWAKQWPEGSRFVALFLFCDQHEKQNTTVFHAATKETTRHKLTERYFAEVVDVPGIGWDARCECSDFEQRGFCSHCEAALLLAERVGKERGAV